ncbi:hypothetical protein [Bradyrhizobium pachyrhizi]|uniref:hypothetical protein n=1 Tax=Bradyrhizobium pachyrhizi TaxID=280333 RepID=UPI000AF496C5|nr:hypothetical protein [Bradyrhizobium pachyrhizi]
MVIFTAALLNSRSRFYLCVAIDRTNKSAFEPHDQETTEGVFIPHFAMALISMRTPFKFKGPVNVLGSTLIPDTKAS